MQQKSPAEQFLLLISLECNLRCPDCLYAKVLGNGHMPVKLVREKILPHLTGKHHVFIAGGEPTQHPSFWKIVGMIAGKKPAFVQILSNGIPFSKTQAQANAFASRMAKLAKLSGTPLFLRVSVDDAHSAKLKGGFAEMKKRVGILQNAFEKKPALGIWFFSSAGRGQTQQELIKKYCLPKDRTRFGTWVEGPFKQAGTVRRVSINPVGDVFPTESEMLAGRAAGNLRKQSLGKILRQPRFH